MKQWILKGLARRMDKSRQHGENGITLIELLAVIVILAIVAGVAIPVVMNSINSSKTSVSKQNMVIIADALSRYAADHNGDYPTSGTLQDAATALTVLTQKSDVNGTPSSTGAYGPYLNGLPTDGWSASYYYFSSSGSHYLLETQQAAHTTSGSVSAPSDSKDLSYWGADNQIPTGNAAPSSTSAY